MTVLRPYAIVALLMCILLAGCLDWADDEASEPGHPYHHPDWPPWPDLGSAIFRPGVGVGTLPPGTVPALDEVFGTSLCTANFVFRSLDNTSLYLGTASHCVIGLEIGDSVSIGDDGHTATLAYCSWGAMDGVSTCSDHSNLNGPEWFNDFALLQVKEVDRGLVHPAVLHYGGPTGVADALSMGDRVLSYGSSSYRKATDAANAREGYVWSQSEWITEVQFLTPGIPGDSGSAVFTPDGNAVGILKYLVGVLEPKPITNGIVNLAPALEFAANHGFEVEVCTWAILDGGALPDPPSA